MDIISAPYVIPIVFIILFLFWMIFFTLRYKKMRAKVALLEQENDGSHAQLLKAASQVPGMLYQFRVRPDGSYCVPFTTEFIREIFGCSPEDVREDFSPVARVIHPDDLARLSGEIEKSIQTLQPFHFEYRVILPDRGERWIWAQSIPEKLPDGSINFYGFNADITERKQVEQKAQESHEKMELLFNLLPVGVSVLDQERKIVKMTPSLERILSISKEGLLRGDYRSRRYFRPDGSLMPPTEFASARVFQGEAQALHVETGVEKEDGSLVWTDVSAVAAPFSDWRTVIVTTDITARKNIEEALRKSEQDYRNLFNYMVDAFAVHEIILDENGLPSDYRFLAINPVFEQMTGLKAQDILGKTVLQVLPETEPYWIQMYGRVALTGEAIHFEHYAQSLNRTYEVTAFQSAPYQFATVFMDITERKRVEQELRESEEKLQNVFKSIRDAIFVVDRQYRLVTCNQAYQNALVATGGREMVAGELVLSLEYPPEFLETWKSHYDRAFGGETVLVDSQLEWLDGRHIFENTLSPIFDLEKNVSGVLVVSHDVTERRRLETEMLQFQKMIGIGTLAAGIAHEMNSPLQVITGYCESLMRDLQDDGSLPVERLTRQLNIVNRNAWRVAEIVRSLQHYAHPEREQVEEVNLNDLVKDVLILMEHQLKSQAKVQIQSDLSADLPMFSCEQNKMMQMLINMLINARDSMPAGGTIVIQTAYRADIERLVLRVVDDGQGISPALLPRIFDPFFTTKPVGEGTGLGLSIVQTIVSAHGGEINVESVPKEGTTFTITLPLTPIVQTSAQDAEDPNKETQQARYD